MRIGPAAAARRTSRFSAPWKRIGHHRSAPIARAAILEGGDVGVTAAAVLRPLLSSPHGSTAAEALDALMAAALDTRAERRLRLAALDALEDMPESGPRARRRSASRRSGARLHGDGARADAVWTDATDGRFPDDPRTLRDALSRADGRGPAQHVAQDDRRCPRP